MNEMMNFENNNGNFDMQQLMNITGQTAMNVNNMSKQLGVIASTVDNICTDVDGLKGRMDRLEQKEEVTTEQKEAIKRALYKRCYEILGNDPFEIEKYFSGFVSNGWSDGKKYAGIGAKYEETKKENFQRAIDYFEAWIPSCGCSKLKEKIDNRAKAKQKAKELGYIS